MIVQVKAKHIRAGKRKNGECCALAVAIKECVGEASVCISTTHVRVDTQPANMQHLPECYILSGSAKKYVKTFDIKGKSAVKPATFRLKKQQPVVF